MSNALRKFLRKESNPKGSTSLTKTVECVYE